MGHGSTLQKNTGNAKLRPSDYILFALCAESLSRLGEQLFSFQRCISYVGIETALRMLSREFLHLRFRLLFVSIILILRVEGNAWEQEGVLELEG